MSDDNDRPPLRLYTAPITPETTEAWLQQVCEAHPRRVLPPRDAVLPLFTPLEQFLDLEDWSNRPEGYPQLRALLDGGDTAARGLCKTIEDFVAAALHYFFCKGLQSSLPEPSFSP